MGKVILLITHYYDTEKQDLQNRKAIILESLLSGAVLQSETSAEIEDNQLFQKAWETISRIITPNQQGNSFPTIPYAQILLSHRKISYLLLAHSSALSSLKSCTLRES